MLSDLLAGLVPGSMTQFAELESPQSPQQPQHPKATMSVELSQGPVCRIIALGLQGAPCGQATPLEGGWTGGGGGGRTALPFAGSRGGEGWIEIRGRDLPIASE